MKEFVKGTEIKEATNNEVIKEFSEEETTQHVRSNE